MGMHLTRRGVLQSHINVIPMIDILLVLIVIFMLLQSRFVLDVQLPAHNGQPGSGAAEIVLELGRDGSYAINGQPVALGDLARELQALYADRPRRLLFVKAARERSYQDVITAVDLARGAGVEVIGYMP